MAELSHEAAQATTPRAVPRRRLKVPEWLKLLLRNPMSAFGIVLLTVIVLVTLFAPLLTSQDPSIPMSLPGQAPSWTNPMGTTDQGFSVYTQVIHGGRISLMVALAATVIAMTISIVLGLLAAYKGGVVDDVINLAANVFATTATAPFTGTFVDPAGVGDREYAAIWSFEKNGLEASSVMCSAGA